MSKQHAHRLWPEHKEVYHQIGLLLVSCMSLLEQSKLAAWPERMPRVSGHGCRAPVQAR